MIDTKKAILESIRYKKLFNKTVSPFVNLFVINLGLIDQDNIMTLIDAINETSVDDTRSMKFILLFPSNRFKEYADPSVDYYADYNIDDFMIEFTDELEKRDLERYILLLNPIVTKKEELV